MSSITKILAEKDTPAAEKLQRVAEVVAAAREAYGNQDAEIKAPMVNTTHGSMNFNHLEDDSKVELLKGEIQSIKAQVVEFCENNEGASFTRKTEEILATHGMFVNISAGTKFEYI